MLKRIFYFKRTYMMITNHILNLKIFLTYYDDIVARKCSSLFDKNENSLFHFLLVLVEYSFHGVPWLALAVIGYFVTATDPKAPVDNDLAKKFLFVLIGKP